MNKRLKKKRAKRLKLENMAKLSNLDLAPITAYIHKLHMYKTLGLPTAWISTPLSYTTIYNPPKYSPPILPFDC